MVECNMMKQKMELVAGWQKQKKPLALVLVLLIVIRGRHVKEQLHRTKQLNQSLQLIFKKQKGSRHKGSGRSKRLPLR